MKPKTSLNSEELNLLILKYLEESGFKHAAFTFQQECNSNNIAIPNQSVNPGALVNLALKGLQYMEIEAHVDEDGYTHECKASFNLLGQHECDIVPKEVNPNKKFKMRKEREVEDKEDLNKNLEKKIFRDNETDKMNSTTLEPENFSFNNELQSPNSDIEEVQGKLDEQLGGPDPRNKPYSIQVETEAMILNGHDSEVYLCAWNPMFPTHIATSSYDGSSRVWRLQAGSKSDKISSHFLGYTSISESKESSAMDWHPKGTMLAIGSYDGYLRQYTHSGWLRFTTETHNGAILTIKYCPKGSYILSAGMDFIARLWNSNNGTLKQSFEWHGDVITSVSWQSDNTFTTASLDGKIFVGKVSIDEPVYAFDGHEMGINYIEWDPTGSTLASCSDDKLVKLWNLSQASPLKVLSGHEDTISQVKWANLPTGPNKTRLLVSASDDKSVIVWDISSGSALFRFNDHQSRISAITISPDSKLLASCAFDSNVHVYNTSDGKKIKTFFKAGDMFDLKWSPNNDAIAGCFADSTVALFDVSA